MDPDEVLSTSPFAPRMSLAQSPPTVSPQPHDAQVSAGAPGVSPRPPRRSSPSVAPAPASAAGSQGQKRPLTSPKERRPADVVRMCRSATPSNDNASDVQSESDSDLENPSPVNSMARANKETLLERVHSDLDAIMAAATGAGSRLNKEMTNTIGLSVRDTLAVVAILSLRLSETELKLAEANLKCKTLEHDALKTKAPQDRVRKVGNAGVVVQTSTKSDAEKLRKAVPPTLRVTEPSKKQPRLSLRNLDGDPTEDFVLTALHD